MQLDNMIKENGTYMGCIQTLSLLHSYARWVSTSATLFLTPALCLHLASSGS